MRAHARFRSLLAGFGADPVRWPNDRRVDAAMRLERSPEARRLLERARRVDGLIVDATRAADRSLWEAGAMADAVDRIRNGVAARIADAASTGIGRRSTWRADRRLRGLIVWPTPLPDLLRRLGVTTGLGGATAAGLCLGWMQVGPDPAAGVPSARQAGPLPGLVF